MNEKWFELSIPQIEKKLKTNAASGLSRKAARSRANKNQDALFLVPRKTYISIIAELFSDFALILLLLASLLSLFFEEYRTGALIFTLICLNLGISFFVLYYSARTMEGMFSYFYPKARVVRGGKLFYSDGRTLVPGDVILLEKGDILCCDARLVHSHDLRIRMQIDQEHYTDLDKYAEGFVRPQEHRPWEMTNMVHGGSVILKGSARAIVTDIGKYTYLGALTNGIKLPFSYDNPKYLNRLRQQCAKWNLILLLTVLPLTLISLLVGHFFGGTVLLSGAFLTSMSIVATGGTQLFCTLGNFFYIKKMRVILRSANPSAPRTVSTYDRLANLNYLFVMDGAALSDGIWHYYSAYTADGNGDHLSLQKKSSQKLNELVALYHAAVTETVSTGSGNSIKYSDGIQEFLSASHIDKDALRIRCELISYLPGNLHSEGEKLCVSDRGQRFWMSVTTSSNVLNHCSYTLSGNKKQLWTDEERNQLHTVYQKILASHQIPLIFSLISDDGSDRDVCFVGMISLKEGIDDKWMPHVRSLERLGCYTIFFTHQSQNPPIPSWDIQGRSVSKHDFLKYNYPVTQGFGKFVWYRDFQTEDVQQLIGYIHSKHQTVGILDFTDETTILSESADLRISCAPIYKGSIGLLTQEIVSEDVSGTPNSTSCSQIVKERADFLIPRPSKSRGGLGALVRARLAAQRAYTNFSDFLRYILGMQIVRILLVLIPMLWGKPTMDSRHIVFCGFVLDFMAFFILSQRNTAHQPNSKDYGKTHNISEFLRGDRSVIIASFLASFMTLVLPYFMGMIDLFDTYLYKTEFSFTSMILIHFAAIIAISYPSWKEIRSAYRNYLILGEGIVIIFVLLGCYSDPALGEWLGIEKNPLPYFILSIIPAITFLIVLLTHPRLHKKGTH